MADPYVKRYLMTPGPTPLPPAVSQAMAQPMTYHRAPDAVEVYARVLSRLRPVFGTDGDVLLFTSSGSGGMESAAANLIAPGDSAVVASCGKFGERWTELCDAYGAKAVTCDFEWGTKVDPGEVDRVLAENPEAGVLFTTLSETSTGVVNDVRALAEVAHSHDALIVIDAVSAAGAVPVCQDEWGLDVVVSGSQKALMAPPGLGFASPNEAALARAGDRAGSRYYFDWARTLAGQRKDPPDSPFTPAVSLVAALDVALDLIEEAGLDEVFERHRLLARATRASAAGLELDLLGGVEDEGAAVCTAIELPDTVDGGEVPKLMRDRYGITIAGGQARLKGRICRIAHCGYYGAWDVVVAVAGLEMTLRELGHPVELGSGVGAAQQVFLDAGVAATAPPLAG